MTDTLTFVKEDIPSISRENGNGREPIKWEEMLSPVRDQQGQSFRAWTYGKKTAASSRKAAVTRRLIVAAPNEDWLVTVRDVPNTDPQEYGVYCQFNGLISDEEVAARAKARADHAEKVRVARAAAAEAKSTVPDTPAETTQTPAQRVAAAKKAASK